MFLIDCQYWYEGERYGLEKLSGGSTFFEPMFIYTPGKAVGVYYNYSDTKQDSYLLANYFGLNENYFFQLAKDYQTKAENLLERIKHHNDQIVFSELYIAIADFFSYLAIICVLGGYASVRAKESIQKQAYQLRTDTDTVVYEAGLKLEEIIKQIVNQDDAPFLLYEELISHSKPPASVLKKRKNGYIYYQQKLYTGSVGAFCTDHNIQIVDYAKMAGDLIRGQSASSGQVTGRAQVVYELKDLNKVEAGDILIMPMTTPDFLPAMHKAAAFVTDEGGITSHASIVAREMGKPCIIGTKIATQVLKDGMIVEVDADKGVVRILNEQNV